MSFKASLHSLNSSMHSSRWIIDTVLLTTLLAFLVVVLLPFSPSYFPVPTLDPGVFLYAGRMVREGGLPYRDFWDQKPPLIFYINALGLSLGAGDAQGVYWLKVALLLLGAIIGFTAMRRSFGLVPAVFGTLLWMAYRPLLTKEGNIPEEYALPLQFATIALVLKTGVGRKAWLLWFAVGNLAGLAMLLKPTLIGAMLAAILVVIAPAIKERAWGRATRAGLVFAVGLLAPVALSVVVALAQGYLADYWSSVVLYALSYSAVDRSSYLDILSRLTDLFHPTVLIGVGLGYVAATLAIIFLKRDTSLFRRLLTWSLVSLPLELLLIGLPQRSYMHYYLALLPCFSVLLAGFLYLVQEWFDRAAGRWGAPQFKAAGVVLAVVFGTFSTGRIAFRDLVRTQAALETPRANTLEPVISYLDRMVQPSDKILIWGAEAGANFVTGHDAPTRFVYQYPLFMPGYTTRSLISTLLEEVAAKPPPVIIDAAVIAQGGIPSFKSVWTGEWRGEAHDAILEPGVVEGVREWADWVRNNYVEDVTIGDWTMYVKR